MITEKHIEVLRQMTAPITDPTGYHKGAAEAYSLLSAVDAIVAIVNGLDEGEVTPEADAQLSALELTVEQRAEAYHFVRKRLAAEALACKEEAARLAKRAAARSVSIARLDERMTQALQQLGTSIKTPLVTCYLQETTSVEITGPVPRDWCLAPKEPEPSKSLIKEALSLDPKGECSKFAKLVKTKSARYR